MIKSTMMKIDLYSKSHSCRDEIQKVIAVLEKIHHASLFKKFPDSQEAVQSLIKAQGLKKQGQIFSETLKLQNFETWCV